MMIRRTTRDDIHDIVELYAHTKNSVELSWLLPDPLEQNPFRSFVAVSENNVVGHIGYVVSKFRYNGLEFSGVHPQAWIVSPEYRKHGIGLKLMMKVLDMGDFGYLIGGSKATMRIFPSLGFTLKYYIHEYVKSLKPSPASPSSRTKKNMISLVAYNKKAPVKNRFLNDVFINTQERNHINWLLDCPLCNTYAFSISQNDEQRGIVICYIGKNGNDILTGRIVHLSYLGDEPDSWQSTIFEIEQFLMRKGCSVATALASHPTYINTLIDMGYSQRSSYPVAAFNENGRPFFLRDPQKNLPEISDESFHWTFLEGDMGYRNL
jgi:hypothetical protein